MIRHGAYISQYSLAMLTAEADLIEISSEMLKKQEQICVVLFISLRKFASCL